ncbi:MAG: HlyD family secretion protein, partial [Paraglaciecola sp.]
MRNRGFMDIKKTAKVKHTSKKRSLVFLTIAILVTVSAWSLSQPSGSQKISREQIWIGKVQQGDLSMQVEGYGKLKSKIQRLLAAPADATVDEIVLKPGALVSAESVILRLTNPEIEQQVKDEIRELDNRNTNYLQLELNQQRELLSQKAEKEQLLAQFEIAQLTVEAEQKLVTMGIISGIEFKRSQLDLRQLSRRLEIDEERFSQLVEVQQKGLEIQTKLIEQQQENVQAIKQRFNRLTVKAGIDGVLQSLPVELGQTVSFGQQVALVGSVDNLYAMLNVSQSQMEQVKINQAVVIDTRAGSIKGHVSRISPVVTQNTIAVEVALESELPQNARPELNIDGVIA